MLDKLVVRHKSASSVCGRACHRDRLTRRFLHVLLEYSENPVTEHKERPTHKTNTSTGDATTPYRTYARGTRRERQSVVKVVLHCIHKATKGVVDDVRPELRDGRYENRPSWSHGRTRASRARVEAVKVQRSPLKVAASQPQPCWPYLLLIQRLAGRRRRPQAVIHSAFMGREHPLFHGGVVTKAVGVCVDGCQYQPRVNKPQAMKRRHKLSAQADVQAEAVDRSAATPSVSPALSNHRLLSDLSSASGLSPSLLCDDALGWFASPPSLSSPLSRFAPPP